MDLVDNLQLPQWLNRSSGFTSLECLPVCEELSLVKLCPRQDQAMLRPREPACDELNLVDGVDPSRVLVASVEVGTMMSPPWLDKHVDDDSEKPGNLWHGQPPRCAMRDAQSDLAEQTCRSAR